MHYLRPSCPVGPSWSHLVPRRFVACEHVVHFQMWPSGSHRGRCAPVVAQGSHFQVSADTQHVGGAWVSPSCSQSLGHLLHCSTVALNGIVGTLQPCGAPMEPLLWIEWLRGCVGHQRCDLGSLKKHPLLGETHLSRPSPIRCVAHP